MQEATQYVEKYGAASATLAAGKLLGSADSCKMSHLPIHLLLVWAFVVCGCSACLSICASAQCLTPRMYIPTGEVAFGQFAKALHKEGSQDRTGNTLGYAARDSGRHLSPFVFDWRALNDDDVCIQITHCGICHGDPPDQE